MSKELEKTKTKNADVMQKAETSLKLFLEKDIVSDFSTVPVTAKMTILLAIAPNYVKERSIGKDKDKRDIMVPYLDHYFAKKATNFLFNFDVSNEITHSEYSVFKEPYFEWDEKARRKLPAKNADGTLKTRELFESSVTVKFTFSNPMSGKENIRTVIGTAKSYANPATSRRDVEKMALSNAWSLFLQTFGINPKEISEKESHIYGGYNEEPEEKEESYSQPQEPQPLPGQKTFTF